MCNSTPYYKDMANIIVGGTLLLPYLFGLYITEKIGVRGWLGGFFVFWIIVAWNWMLLVGLVLLVKWIIGLCVN